jgi:hypothetical protein
MCIICVELEKSLISTKQAQKNLEEMSPDLSLDHILEVEEKINNAERKNQFIELLKNDQTVEFCSGCHCDPCDCDWGTNE